MYSPSAAPRIRNEVQVQEWKGKGKKKEEDLWQEKKEKQLSFRRLQNSRFFPSRMQQQSLSQIFPMFVWCRYSTVVGKGEGRGGDWGRAFSAGKEGKEEEEEDGFGCRLMVCFLRDDEKRRNLSQVCCSLPPSFSSSIAILMAARKKFGEERRRSMQRPLFVREKNERYTRQRMLRTTIGATCRFFPKATKFSRSFAASLGITKKETPLIRIGSDRRGESPLRMERGCVWGGRRIR